MELTITLVGLFSILGTVIGLGWKFWTYLRRIEKELTNDQRHMHERLEDKVDKLSDKLDEHITYHLEK